MLEKNTLIENNNSVSGADIKTEDILKNDTNLVHIKNNTILENNTNLENASEKDAKKYKLPIFLSKLTYTEGEIQSVNVGDFESVLYNGIHYVIAVGYIFNGIYNHARMTFIDVQRNTLTKKIL